MTKFNMFILVACVMMMSVVYGQSAQKPAFPGWDKDLAVYQEAYAQFKAINPDGHWDPVETCIAIKQSGATTFAEMVDACKNLANPWLAGRYVFCNRSTMSDDTIKAGYNYYRTGEHNTYYTIFYLGPDTCTRIGFTYEAALDLLMSEYFVMFPQYEHIYYVATDLILKVDNEEKCKTYLKKLNRTASSYLVGDRKAAFEPIVAKIRTMLQTY